MRIAVANWTSRVAGGAEVYLLRTLPNLEAMGHSLALFHECDEPRSRPEIVAEGWLTRFSCAALGPDAALDALRRWKPDIIYVNGLVDPALESVVTKIAPAVASAHSYYGTCISGSKSVSFPVLEPCSRPFGPACLANYFPRRCGGVNPVTMVREYRRQAARLSLLRTYPRVVVHSRHMRNEYAAHGITTEQIDLPMGDDLGSDSFPRSAAAPSRILFVGRLERLKGGAELIAALPLVAREVQRELTVTFVGEGPDGASWARLASQLGTGVRSEFRGWLSGPALQEVVKASEVVAIPSLWPEPFGMVGLEAGMYGIPAVAFAVGGIRDWLVDGKNGALAPGDPPTVTGLAEAMVRCLRDPATFAQLRRGARSTFEEFSARRGSANALHDVFERVLAARRGAQNHA